MTAHDELVWIDGDAIGAKLPVDAEPQVQRRAAAAVPPALGASHVVRTRARLRTLAGAGLPDRGQTQAGPELGDVARIDTERIGEALHVPPGDPRDAAVLQALDQLLLDARSTRDLRRRSALLPPQRR